MNVSDQSSIFIHETKMLISICWTEQMAEYKTFKKRDVIALKRQYVFFCTIVTPRVGESVESALSTLAAIFVGS